MPEVRVGDINLHYEIQGHGDPLLMIMGLGSSSAVDVEFFSGTAVKSNFLINIGHGDPAKLFPRSLRLSFEEIARIV